MRTLDTRRQAQILLRSRIKRIIASPMTCYLTATAARHPRKNGVVTPPYG
jgi:hypothetical protein